MTEVFLAYLEPADGNRWPILSMYATMEAAEQALKEVILSIYDEEDWEDLAPLDLFARLEDEVGRQAFVEAYDVRG